MSDLRLPSDARAWSSGDPWLLDEVEFLESIGGAFYDFAAVGLVFRLGRRTLEEDAAIGRALVNGEPLEGREAAPRWASSLPEEALEEVEQHAAVVVGRLEAEMDRVIDHARVSNPIWRRDLLEILRERDLLEGVALLLESADRGVRLGRALARFDHRGRKTLEDLPSFVVPEEAEQLRRSREAEPGAWWAESSPEN